MNLDWLFVNSLSAVMPQLKKYRELIDKAKQSKYFRCRLRNVLDGNDFGFSPSVKITWPINLTSACRSLTIDLFGSFQ